MTFCSSAENICDFYQEYVDLLNDADVYLVVFGQTSCSCTPITHTPRCTYVCVWQVW